MFCVIIILCFVLMILCFKLIILCFVLIILCFMLGGEPVMIFSNKHDLRQIHLFTGRYRPLLEDVNSAVAVDYDLEARTLYWSDVTSENISR